MAAPTRSRSGAPTRARATGAKGDAGGRTSGAKGDAGNGRRTTGAKADQAPAARRTSRAKGEPGGAGRRSRVASDGSPARGRAASAAGRAAPSRDRRSGAPKRAAAPGRERQIRAAVPVVGGIVWGLLLFAAVALSSLLTALVLIPVAAVATASGVRAVEARGRSRKGRQRPSLVLIVALAASVILPLAALAGPMVAVAGLVLAAGGILVLVVTSGYAASARPLRTVAPRLVSALAPTIAATCVVLARHQGSGLGTALVGAILVYDAGAFLMGNSRTPTGGPVGIGAGLASVAVVAVFVAAVMNPPFSGSRPWLVFAGLAVAAPLGVRLEGLVTGGDRLPAVRRLDSLCLAAPLWVLAVALLLHR